ncbi:hypothetical protein [Candidatus Cardinium hertigii]|jgi:flagellar biosynthesis/type III secretory pathway protein FliH|uniref:Transposase n=1 Tax=Candidatus Cardinium hertigii TaxID=247481 RepID=A0A3N2QD28_9BACT|nr:hypothetical protein [Candidatus Cardinium hertigii]ROT47522.1 hypothetical protein EDM02_01980 [Candidatus Cardinium hertigii]
MRTIAQKYIDEGMQQGIIQGIEKGMEKGMEKEKAEIAQKMLANNMDATLIAHITGLDVSFIRTLTINSVYSGLFSTVSEITNNLLKGRLDICLVPDCGSLF